MSLILPDYRVIEKVGHGANSDIYRVASLETGEYRAAKYVPFNAGDENKFIDQLKAEQLTAQAMTHPVLREVYDLRHIRKRLRLQASVLMMEYVDGYPLSSRGIRPIMSELLTWFRDVAEGLRAMHLAGYVHADLKPGNIMINSEGKVKLIDFGQSSPMHQAKGRVQGTIDYMAPEQARGAVLDQRTDVFGLGAALYRILTLQPISTEMNRTAGLHAPTRIGKRRSEFQKPTQVEAPTCVMRFIDDCIRDDPVERISDMRAVINRIDLTLAILEQHRSTGTEVAGDGSKDSRKPIGHSDGEPRSNDSRDSTSA
jgi:serine/threonine-protein kinase